MNKFRLLISIITVFIILISGVFAQTGGLPRLKKGESYRSVRKKMIKNGWKPFHAADSDECRDDSRCAGRPEMHRCAGTGLGNCEFLWKRNGRTLAIYTIGEEGGGYDDKAFVKPPDY